MKFTTTVTQKGQITLPKAFRDALGIHPYDQVQLTLKKNLVQVESTEDILDLAGTFKPRKNAHRSIESARRALEKTYERA